MLTKRKTVSSLSSEFVSLASESTISLNSEVEPSLETTATRSCLVAGKLSFDVGLFNDIKG